MRNLKKKRKIFIGINEIGDMSLCLAQGFRELGFEVTNIVSEIDRPLKRRREKHDGYIKRTENKYLYFLYRLKAFLENVPYHDIFIFIFSETFFSFLLSSRHEYLRPLSYFELPLLKLMGKKIVVCTNGCDVRHYSLVEREAQEKGDKYHICFDCDLKEKCSLSLKTMKVKKIEKYADYIISHPLTGYLFKRKYLMTRLPINLKTISFKINNSAEPLILHAPSYSMKKGTKYLLETIEKLKEEDYRFKFLLCENMDNAEVRQKLSQSEIVVDQLLARAHGLFAIEAMASGNVVLGNVQGGHYGFPEELPILTTNPDKIYENLKTVLENPQLRAEMAQRGRVYVEKYHDHIKVARDFLRQIGEAESL
ncbi:MAG: glycosyltransferase [Methanotrichaceae archaeon]|nr:glycosyltransferase [Methanotrichaceae archaeon]